MVGQQHFAFGHARCRLAAEVKDDLEQLSRVDALVQSSGQVWRQGAGEELDLLVPVGATRLPACFSHHPNDGTSPFSRTGFGTRSASSLTRRSWVRRTVNPRPRRASIMCES